MISSRVGPGLTLGALSVLTIFSAVSCGGSDTLSEGVRLSGEVQEVRASETQVEVGQTFRVNIAAEAADLVIYQDLVVFVRYSPQLELASPPYVSILPINTTNDDGVIDDIGIGFYGNVPPFCAGSSSRFGDKYLGLVISGFDFSDANSKDATIQLVFRAVAKTPSAFIVASAGEEPGKSSECEEYNAPPEGAVEILVN